MALELFLSNDPFELKMNFREKSWDYLELHFSHK